MSGDLIRERSDGWPAPAAVRSTLGRSERERVSSGLLDRLYARFGTRYLVLVLAWLELLGLAGGMLSAVVATRLLAQSYRPPSALALLVEGAILVGCGVPILVLAREARPLIKWIRDGRPENLASEAWHIGVTRSSDAHYRAASC